MLSVLVIEDDEGHATLVQRGLARAGLTSPPVRLRDGQELLDYLNRRGRWAERDVHPEVAMILDLNMPRLGGTEVLRQLKDDAELSRIPVFVLTTTDNPIELDRCYALGAAACLVKPVDYAAFNEVTRRLAQFLLAARLPGELPVVSSDHAL